MILRIDINTKLIIIPQACEESAFSCFQTTKDLLQESATLKKRKQPMPTGEPEGFGSVGMVEQQPKYLILDRKHEKSLVIVVQTGVGSDVTLRQNARGMYQSENK